MLAGSPKLSLSKAQHVARWTNLGGPPRRPTGYWSSEDSIAERLREDLGTVDTRRHWEEVYQKKRPTEVSWYRPHLDVSLQLIEDAADNRDAHIIDVGAGESTLVDDLLDRGYRNVYAMDLSTRALDVARTRL